MIIPVVITDGRGEFLKQTIDSMFNNVDGLHYPGVLVDDSGDPEYKRWLDAEYALSFKCLHHGARQGLAASIRDGWTEAITDPDVEAIWHVEDDYVVPEKLDVRGLAALLRAVPDLAELTLKRGPYSSEEHTAGGYMEGHLDEYEDVTVLDVAHYVKHDQLFFFQPSLIPRPVVTRAVYSGLPITEPNLATLLVPQGYHFGVVGKIADPPRVEHIGTYRSAGWSL